MFLTVSYSFAAMSAFPKARYKPNIIAHALTGNPAKPPIMPLRPKVMPKTISIKETITTTLSITDKYLRNEKKEWSPKIRIQNKTVQ